MNHIEPDHSVWLPGFLKMNPQVQIYTTKKGAAMVKGFFGVEDNVQIIKSGNTLSVRQGKELLFEEAPNVHWPGCCLIEKT